MPVLEGITTSSVTWTHPPSATFPEQELLRAITENADVSMFIKDLDGRFVYVNRVFCERHGLPEQALLGRSYRELCQSKGEIEQLQAHDEAVLKARAPLRFEESVRVRGELREHQVTKFLLNDASGQPMAICGVAVDITERLRAEARFRRFFELPLLGRALTAPDTRFLEVNQTLADMLGYSIAELVGRSWKAVTHPEDIDAHLSHLEEVIAGKHDVYSMEKRFVHRDGHIVQTSISAGCIRRSDRSIDHLVLIVQDVTARKQAEDALRRSEERYRLVANATNDAIYDFDLTTDTVEWNDQYQKLFGWETQTGSAARVWFARIHPDDRARVKRELGELTAHGTIEHLRFRHKRADGTFVHVVLHSFVLRDSAGRAVRSVGSLSDVSAEITVKETLEAEVAERRRAEQLAHTYTATMSATLNSLVIEPRFDAFAGQVLNTIVEQLGGIGGAFWVRDAGSALVNAIYVHEDGRLVRGRESSHPLAQQWMRVPLQVAPATQAQLFTLSATELDAERALPASIREYFHSRHVRTVLGVRLVFDGDTPGGFSIYFKGAREFGPQEELLAKGLVLQATLAMRLAQMEEETRKATLVQERNRMARDIHDTLAQGFTGVIVQLEAAKDVIASGQRDKADGHIDRAMELARSMLAEARRSVHALRPASLEVGGLRGAFESLLHRMTDGTGIQATFDLRGRARHLPLDWEDALLRAGQESLTNALRHAETRRFSALLAFEPTVVELTLTDDGHGFDPTAPNEGHGLRGMRERAERLGGELIVRSTIGVGTQITFRLHNP